MMTRIRGNAHCGPAMPTGPLGKLLLLTAGSLGFFSQSTHADYASEILGEQPLAYYRFDDSVTEDDVDPAVATNLGSLGAAGDGSFNGTVTRGSAGVIAGDNGISLSQANATDVNYVGSVNIPNNPALNPSHTGTNPFTLECWVKPKTNVSTYLSPVNSMSFTTGRAGFMIYQNAGTWELRLGNKSSTTASFLNGGTVNAGQWQHLVATYSGGTLGTMTLYVNGVQVGSAALTGAGYEANDNGPFVIGGTSVPSRTFDGSVDEVAFFNTELSSTRIAERYNQATANPAAYQAHVLADAPVGYWRLNEAPFVPRTSPVATNAGSLGTSADGAYYAGSKNTQSGPDSSSGFLGFGASNSALSLATANGYVGTSQSMLNNLPAYTVMGWIKRGALKSTRGGYFGQNDVLEFGDDNTTGIEVWNSASLYASHSSAATDDTWEFIVLTSDGNSNILFLNGVQVASRGGGHNASSAYHFNIGGGGVFNDSGDYFRGEIDEVAVFDKVLPPARVRQLYDAALGNVIPAAATVTITPGEVVLEGQSYTLTCTEAIGTPPFSYQWQRDGLDIPGATALTYTVNSATVNSPADQPIVYTMKISNPATAPTVPEEIPYRSNEVWVNVSQTRYWTGTNGAHPTFWDIGSTANWSGNADGSGASGQYIDYSPAIFNDAATGTNVEIQSDVTPFSVVFSNQIKSFTVSGSSIVGTGSLTKSGDAGVTLNNDNFYTGGTIVNGGTLTAGSPYAFGDVSSTLSFGSASTGKVQLNGNSITFAALNSDMTTPDTVILESGSATEGTDELTISGSANSGFSGILRDGGTRLLALAKYGNGNLTLSGSNTYSGLTTISGGVLQIGNGGATGTLGSGEIDNNAILRFNRSGAYSASNSITGAGNIYVATGSDITLSGPLTCNSIRMEAGGSTLTLTGSAPNVIGSVTCDQDSYGTVVLAKPAGVDALSGDVKVGGGGIGDGYASQFRIRLENNEQIADSSVVTMYGWDGGYGGSSSFQLNGYNETIAGLSGGSSTSNVYNGAATPSVLTLAGAGNYTMGNGAIHDNGPTPLSLVKSGTGTQTFGGNQIDYNGPTTVNAGRLVLLNNDDTWTTGMNIAAGAVVEINRNNGTEYEHRNSFTLSGAGTLEKTGNGIMNMNWDRGGCAVNMAPGGLIHVKEGSLRLGYGMFLDWSNNKGDLTVENGAVFDMWDTDGVIVNSLNGAGNITKGSYGKNNNLTVGVMGGSGDFSGSISNATGVTNLVKQGGGTQILSGANSYTGSTTVNGGVLLVNGSLAANSAVTVASGATLGGSGTVNGTVNAAGSIAPGNSIGTLHTGAATLSGAYVCEISGSTSDVLAVTGNLTLSAASLSIQGTPTAASYVIATYSGTLTGTFTAPTLSGYRVDYATTGQIKLVQGGASFSSWMDGFTFEPGADKSPTGDADHDGISNAVEMVLGGNPATGMDAALMPTLTLVTDPGGSVPAGDYMLFTYRRSDLAVDAGLGIDCQYDTDVVGNWTSATGAPGVVILTDDNYPWTNPASANTDRIRVYIPRASHPKLFGRLSATLP